MSPIGDEGEHCASKYLVNELYVAHERIEELVALVGAMQNCYNCKFERDEDCAPPRQGQCPKWAWVGAKKEGEQT